MCKLRQSRKDERVTRRGGDVWRGGEEGLEGEDEGLGCGVDGLDRRRAVAIYGAHLGRLKEAGAVGWGERWG